MNKQKVIYQQKPLGELPSGRALQQCGCGKWYSLPACHAKRHRSCTSDCAKERSQALVQASKIARRRECGVCGSLFSPRQWQIDVGGGRYCSQACNSVVRLALLHSPKMKIKAREGYKLAQAAGRIAHAVGPDHPSWKGGRYVTRDGYIQLSVGGKVKQEHRLVVERAIGRPLLTEEIVHHINHVKDDNRLENLQILSRSEHAKEHAGDFRNLWPLRGSSSPLSKLTEAAVRHIRTSQETDTALARAYGVTATAVGYARRGVTWKHVS